jgi:Fungal chitosanase of glycosyl hydrolase group 75
MSITYKPQGVATLLLDSIPTLFLHPKTKEIKTAFEGKTFMCKFPGGQIYYESKLAVDTDGSPYWNQDGPPAHPFGQPDTATHNADGSALDADLINYYVLPGGFWEKQGIRKGDIAVVIYGIRKAYAIFGDVGPVHSLGEGSIALHRELGNETISGRDNADGGHLINGIHGGNGIASGVITIVFPKSGNGFGQSNQDMARIGEPLFQKLIQEAAIGDYPLQAAGRFRNVA